MSQTGCRVIFITYMWRGLTAIASILAVPADRGHGYERDSDRVVIMVGNYTIIRRPAENVAFVTCK